MLPRALVRKRIVNAHHAKLAPAGTSDWRTAASLLALSTQVNQRWPDRKTASDGTIGDAHHRTRDSDHNPWVKDGHIGVVTAIDITHDPAGGADAQGVVDALVASRDRRIKYIIWNRRIVSATVSPWSWRPYNGSNPHTAHFHLSVSSSKPLYDDTGRWTIE